MTPRPDPSPLDPDELAALEEAARRSLGAATDGLTPQSRYDDIRAAALGDGTGRRSGWWWPLVSAAAVAIVAVGAWGALVGRPTPVVDSGRVPVATATPPASTVPSTVPPTTGPPTTAPATTSPTSPAGPVGLPTTAFPAYFVEQVVGTSYGLVREFVPSSSTARLGTADGAAEAARLSMTATPAHATGTVVSAWTPGTTLTVTLQGGEADVLLSRAGRTGLTAEQQRLAVQQLVWAVTAGLQRTLPVGVVVATGGNVFESVPAGVFKRPAPDQAFRDVAPIWVDSPAQGASYPVGAPMTVTGQACTVEAAVAWVLQQGATTVRSGHTTASSGCPVQGRWSVALGPLPAGTYTVHVRELSAQDGGVRGDQQVTFTVR